MKKGKRGNEKRRVGEENEENCSPVRDVKLKGRLMSAEFSFFTRCLEGFATSSPPCRPPFPFRMQPKIANEASYRVKAAENQQSNE